MNRLHAIITRNYKKIAAGATFVMIWIGWLIFVTLFAEPADEICGVGIMHLSTFGCQSTLSVIILSVLITTALTGIIAVCALLIFVIHEGHKQNVQQKVSTAGAIRQLQEDFDDVNSWIPPLEKELNEYFNFKCKLTLSAKWPDHSSPDWSLQFHFNDILCQSYPLRRMCMDEKWQADINNFINNLKKLIIDNYKQQGKNSYIITALSKYAELEQIEQRFRKQPVAPVTTASPLPDPTISQVHQ